MPFPHENRSFLPEQSHIDRSTNRAWACMPVVPRESFHSVPRQVRCPLHRCCQNWLPVLGQCEPVLGIRNGNQSTATGARRVIPNPASVPNRALP